MPLEKVFAWPCISQHLPYPGDEVNIHSLFEFVKDTADCLLQLRWTLENQHFRSKAENLGIVVHVAATLGTRGHLRLFKVLHLVCLFLFLPLETQVERATFLWSLRLLTSHEEGSKSK